MMCLLRANLGGKEFIINWKELLNSAEVGCNRFLADRKGMSSLSSVVKADTVVIEIAVIYYNH